MGTAAAKTDSHGELMSMDDIMLDAPSVEMLEGWMMDGGCEATDGCFVEPDGYCCHGKPSWLIVMGVI